MLFRSAQVEVENNFSSEGINQTKHEIILNVKTNVTVIIPTGNILAEITTQIPVADTIIVGKVPNTYTNIEGTNKNTADAGLVVSGE